MATSHCANPLLLEFVQEWLDAARLRNTKGINVYKKAYESLKACPIAFSHPSETQQLHGLGPKLSEKLTARLKEHCQQNGLEMPAEPHRRKRPQPIEASNGQQSGGLSPPSKKARKARPYVPALRSGAYALILALSTLREGALQGITKTDVIELAQPYCDSSFTAPSDPTKFYTAWNSMKTLVDKDIVCERGRPSKRYSLTDEGWEAAKRIRRTLELDLQDSVSSTNGAELGTPIETFSSRQLNSTIAKPSPSTTIATAASHRPERDDLRGEDESLPLFRPIVLPPQSFTVHLVLDVREIRATTDRDYMRDELTKRGVQPIMRSLEVGDALWVAKCTDRELLTQFGAEDCEIMLDWIVERKRLDDLISSIKDGRFREQKFRLKKSGVRNVIYVVEEISMSSDHFQRYEEAVESAIASSQVVDGYFLKRTQKMDDTVRYLARMTALLKEEYEAKPLHVIPSKFLTPTNYIPLLEKLQQTQPERQYNIGYSAFAALSSKSDILTLRDIYLKMLMCTKGITGEKALNIQKIWNTPFELVKAFSQLGAGDQWTMKKHVMLAERLGNLVGRHKVGKALSRRVFEVWGGA